MEGMIHFSDLIVIACGSVILFLWLMLFYSGKKDAEMFEGLDDEDYPLHEIYFVGYQLTKLLKLEYKDANSRHLRRQLCSLYEERFADYYIRVCYSQRYTMTLTLMVLAAPAYFLTQSIIPFFLMFIVAIVAYFYYGKATEELVKKKTEQYLLDFSDVVSKLALMVNSGMILTEAWSRVAYSADRPLYLEMQASVDAMRNGSSLSVALYELGKKCLAPEIRKFTSTLIQGHTEGNQKLPTMLVEQSSEVWNMKKQMVRRKGESANDLLLLPMCLTFIGILIMIIVPIFANLGV